MSPIVLMAALIGQPAGETVNPYPPLFHHVAAPGAWIVIPAGVVDYTTLEPAAMGEMVEDAVLVNESSQTAYLFSPGVGPIWVGPGQIVVVDEYAFDDDGTLWLGGFGGGFPYGRTCLCRCGSGWVSVPGQTPCDSLNGEGPCLDPNTNDLVDQFTDCRPGWGPVVNP